MPTIYISDSGDDKNDGLSLQTAVYSLKRAKKLHGGRNDYSWHFGSEEVRRAAGKCLSYGQLIAAGSDGETNFGVTSLEAP